MRPTRSATRFDAAAAPTCGRGSSIKYVSTLLRSRSSLGLPFEPPAPVLLALGSAHFRNGDRIRAEYYWREATRINDGFGEAWNNLAAVYAATARRAEARTRSRAPSTPATASTRG